MSKQWFQWVLVFGGLWAPVALAAPQDAFLSAMAPAGQAEVELGVDAMNGTLDVFNVREQSSGTAGTNIGDYQGWHVLGRWSPTRHLSLDGGFWQRQIDYREDTARLNSWQAAAQYRVREADGPLPALALRLGAWGNFAGELQKSTGTRLGRQQVDSVHITDPEDQQAQLDLIASWPLRQDLDLSVFAGGGLSRVRVGELSGTAHAGQCRYALQFGESAVTADQIAPCETSSGMVITDSTLFIPYSAYGVNPYQEIEYDARFLQSGFMLQWQLARWQLRGGYQFLHLERDRVDAAIESRGGTSYQNNHILMGEVRRGITNHVQLFLRGQYLRYQFNGQIPFAYNSFTAHRFANQYGLLSAGLVLGY